MVVTTKQHAMLTKREKEVLDLAAKGCTKNEIAAKLFVSHHTIKKHFENIYRKLKVKNKVQALNKFN